MVAFQQLWPDASCSGSGELVTHQGN